MSMPSSSALVDTTPSTSPDAQPLLHLAAAVRQVAAAIAADDARITRLVLDAALDGGSSTSVESRLWAKTMVGDLLA